MRRNQGVTIAALIIAIVGLSIGFAAFSNTLTIRSSATVNPDSSSLRVVFSLDDDSEVPGGTGGVTPNSNTYGDPGTIDNTNQGNSKIEGLHAKFTAPGQSVKYNTNLYVYNAGSLQAQLTGVTFNNAQGINTYKKCTAVTENKQTTEIATDALVQAACSDITISVKVGTKTATPSDTSLNYQILGVGESLPAEITITYGGNVYVDGDFEVSFGDVVINATSAVNQALVVEEVDDLIPTDDEISKASAHEGGAFNIFIEDLLAYSESAGAKFVQINEGSGGYLWICDSDSATIYLQKMGVNVEAKKWYSTSDGRTFTEYTGSFPIDLNSLNSEDIKSESYLNRVIVSFNNN